MSKAKKVIAKFDPLPWQIQPWNYKGFVMLLTGSAGGGKSRLAAEKIHGYCLKYPGATALILRKAREWCYRSIVPFYWKTVCGGAESGIKFNKSEGTFYYPNGSVVYSGGMKDDQQREAVRSIGGDGGIDIAWMEEANAFTRQDFDEVKARIRHTAASWRQLIPTTNPDSPRHWIYTDLIQGGEAKVFYSSARDNPHNAPEYLETLANLHGILLDRLGKGLWKQAEGAVYDEWNDLYHESPFEIPSGWRKIRVVDFGYTNPFVCQWWAIAPESNRPYLYREIYHTKRTVRVHANQINELSKGEEIEVTICDHDAEDRATLEENGIRTIAAYKDITTGIQSVKSRMVKQGIRILEGCTIEIDPELESARKPTSTIAEISGYQWPKGVDGKAIKEVPVKLNDHGMDGMRYLCAYLDGLGYQKVVSIDSDSQYSYAQTESDWEMF